MKNWRAEIRTEIESKGITQMDFCKRAGIHASELNTVINKYRPLSVKLALMLELYFIKTAEYWLTQQIKGQIEDAKKEDTRF